MITFFIVWILAYTSLSGAVMVYQNEIETLTIQGSL